MDVIVAAGGLAGPKDPLHDLTGGGYKSLLDVCGKPMVQHVLDAINQSGRVENVLIMGLPENIPLHCTHPLHRLKDYGNLMSNIRAGADYLLEVNPSQPFVLIVSADIPGLKTEMIDWLVDRVQESDHDIYFCVVERSVMEKRYPGSRRTYTRLKGMEVCGGDANAIRKTVAAKDHPLGGRLHQARKNPLRQARLIGFQLFALLLLNQLTLQSAERRISRRLGIRGRALICPYAEMGMDVDKPFQYDLLLEDMARLRTV